jgi:DNA-binding transcriptional ArsR family regulator
MVRSNRPVDIEEGAAVAKLLSDATRLKVLAVVSFDGPVSVGQVCETTNLPQPTVSHHLGLLRRARLVQGRRNGKQVIYTVGDSRGPADGIKALKLMLDKLTA